MSAYREAGCQNVTWLPHACDPDVHHRWDARIEHDICFIGGIVPGSERERLVSELKRRFKMFVGRAYLHDMARIYSESKIVFNKSLAGDLNMRVFEALSCGRLLLTDRIKNGLEELFADRRHLVLYDGLDDLIESARYYIEHEEERERIALEGQREVLSKHTYAHRAIQILRETKLIC